MAVAVAVAVVAAVVVMVVVLVVVVVVVKKDNANSMRKHLRHQGRLDSVSISGLQSVGRVLPDPKAPSTQDI